MHRFDIISRNGVNYVIACTLKSGHEYKEDWRSLGKIQVCVLPEDLSSVDEVLRSYVAANEGVFECIPPESEEGTWEIKQILDEASSDMAFADFDNDGEDYILSANREIDEIALYCHKITFPFLIVAGHLYYNAEMTQNQIAERFFTSRSKISRMK